MAGEVRVDPIDLRMTNDHVSVAASDHLNATRSHEDELHDAASRWRGESQAAMRELADHWGLQNSEHHQRVTQLAQKISDAADRYAAVDSDSADAIESLSALGTGSADSSVPDLGL